MNTYEIKLLVDTSSNLKLSDLAKLLAGLNPTEVYQNYHPNIFSILLHRKGKSLDLTLKQLDTELLYSELMNSTATITVEFYSIRQLQKQMK